MNLFQWKLILFSFIFSFNSFAQISITSSDMPSSGDTLRYSTADVADVESTFRNTGVNYTWDYSNLKPTGQGITQYLAAGKTPYGFFFIGSYGVKLYDSLGMGTIAITNVYNFFRKTSSSFEANGMGLTFNGMPFPALYNDNDEIYKLPLNYGNRDSTTFYFKTGLGGMIEYSTAGYRINEVDGWGTVKTPFGTFSCLRVKTTIISIDSIGISTMKIGFPNNRMEYKWLAQNIHIPVFEVSGNLAGPGFIPNSVRYRDIYRNVTPQKTLPVDFAIDNPSPTTKDIVNFTDLTGAVLATYSWTITPYGFVYKNGTDSTSQNPSGTFTKPGTYNVKLAVTSIMGYGDTSRKIQVLPSGIKEASENAIHVYPLPLAEGRLFVDISSDRNDDVTFCIYDINGRVIYQKTIAQLAPGKNTIKLELGDLSSPAVLGIQSNKDTKYVKLF